MTGNARHIGDYALEQPDKPAAIFAPTGETTTYKEMDGRSYALAQAFRGRGLREGSHLAIHLENSLQYLEAAWAAQRSGMYCTPVNWHLTEGEAAYIIEDSETQALISSPGLLSSIPGMPERLLPPALALVKGGAEGGWEDYETFLASGADPDAYQLFEQTDGEFMFYSSGTTGRPKGILRQLSGNPFGTPNGTAVLMENLFGFRQDSIYLCPAPLYHAAPLVWSLNTQRIGGTVVVMERFDALEMLQLIERYRVTHVQVVPTMFVRLLKLPDEQRLAYDLSSLEQVIHAAAPCPVEVKERMLDWWGPIIREFYAGSEGSGFCTIGAEEWLAHRGSVGRNTMGPIHILDDDGTSLPPGEVGTIWFEGGPSFEYHNDPVKTAEAFNDAGWSTIGDMGSVDEDGYLFLSDRRTNLILSGGVNIYPQEIEDVLTMHPSVTDVAVIGMPDEELGQRVVAVVTPADPSAAGPGLASELTDYCRHRLARFKCPRQVIFDDDLPRLPSGKLAKRLLHDRYPESNEVATP